MIFVKSKWRQKLSKYLFEAYTGFFSLFLSKFYLKSSQHSIWNSFWRFSAILRKISMKCIFSVHIITDCLFKCVQEFQGSHRRNAKNLQKHQEYKEKTWRKKMKREKGNGRRFLELFQEKIQRSAVDVVLRFSMSYSEIYWDLFMNEIVPWIILLCSENFLEIHSGFFSVNT